MKVTLFLTIISLIALNGFSQSNYNWYKPEQVPESTSAQWMLSLGGIRIPDSGSDGACFTSKEEADAAWSQAYEIYKYYNLSPDSGVSSPDNGRTYCWNATWNGKKSVLEPPIIHL